MKTFSPTPKDIDRGWFVVDAEGKILGRLATEIARRLLGKHKAEYARHMDMGDNIIVVNAEKIQVTGKKLDKKRYYKHTNFPGGLKSKTLREMLDLKPEEVIRKAVRGMLPKTRLARQQLKKLKIYAGAEHPHAAQQPQTLDV